MLNRPPAATAGAAFRRGQAAKRGGGPGIVPRRRSGRKKRDARGGARRIAASGRAFSLVYAPASCARSLAESRTDSAKPPAFSWVSCIFSPAASFVSCACRGESGGRTVGGFCGGRKLSPPSSVGKPPPGRRRAGEAGSIMRARGGAPAARWRAARLRARLALQILSGALHLVPHRLGELPRGVAHLASLPRHPGISFGVLPPPGGRRGGRRRAKHWMAHLLVVSGRHR